MSTIIDNRDKAILRDLAQRYREVCARAVQDERRELWRDHNSLVRTRPPVLCSWHAGSNAAGAVMADALECSDPFLRAHELQLRNMIFHDTTVCDDFVCEPWITVRADMFQPEGGMWGVAQEIVSDPDGFGWRRMPEIASREDMSRMVRCPHRVNEETTRGKVGLLQDAVGDIVPVAVDRSSVYGIWGGTDLSEALGGLVGLEEFMLAIHDDPDFIHAFVGFMRDAVVANIRECEAAGDWKLINHSNMGVPYCRDLPDPSADGTPVRMNDLWFFTCAQEFTLVSPGQYWEFMLQYQMSIMREFGLVSYGCCEDLTDKIDLLRRIPNLRRIAATPLADVARCAEQIGRDYVMSWRPNPAMVVCQFDTDYVRKVLSEGLTAAGDCNVDVMLKDITSVEGDPDRLVEWTRIARELSEAHA